MLTLYILIPAVAAVVAWLLGRVDTRLSRWTAVAGTAVPLVLLAVQWIASAGELRGDFVAKGAGTPAFISGAASASWIDHVKVDLDPVARHQLLPGRRRPHAHHAAAHLRPRPARRALLLARHHRQGRGLPPHGALDGGRACRRVPRARPLPLLLLLRDDADPDVLPHRRLGPRAARVLGDQVLHLHAGERPAHADRHRRAGVHPRARDRRVHLRLHAAARHAAWRRAPPCC